MKHIGQTSLPRASGLRVYRVDFEESIWDIKIMQKASKHRKNAPSLPSRMVVPELEHALFEGPFIVMKASELLVGAAQKRRSKGCS
jgi:hypothetical protein